MINNAVVYVDGFGTVTIHSRGGQPVISILHEEIVGPIVIGLDELLHIQGRRDEGRCPCCAMEEGRVDLTFCPKHRERYVIQRAADMDPQ